MAHSDNRKPTRRAPGETSYEATSRYASKYSRSSDSTSREYTPLQSNPNAYSRYSRDAYGSAGRSNGSASAGSRKSVNRRGGWKKKLAIALVIIAVLAAVGVVAAYAYLNSVDEKLQNGVDDELLAQLQQSEYTGDPFYVLLLGVDRDEERQNSAEFGKGYQGYRTDSMMLARVDPVNKNATLISLPRDTMVDMGEYGTQKLNAAYSLGGPAYAVEVVTKLAGVPISHYAEVDFDGFCSVVDALGGIEVEVPITIDDDDAGGRVEAGYQTLNGTQAMIVCRSRHTYDDVGAGDLYRAANQRMILSAVAKKILNSDPVTMVNVVNTAANAVTTDLKTTDLLGIAYSMRGLDPSTDIYTCCMPTTSKYIDDVWYEVINESEWTTMMSRVDRGLSPTTETVVDETTGTILSSSGDGSTAGSYQEGETSLDDLKASGTVAVRNGSSTSGVAQKAADILTEKGFTTDVGNADAENYATTLVIYSNTTQADMAALIVKTLGVGKTEMNDGTYSFTANYLVVIGADYTS